MNSNREKMTLWIWLSVFALALLLAGFEFLRNGSSAIAIILALFSILVAAKLSHLFQRSHKKLAQVIEAMANDDPTLGLNQTTPLAKKLAQVSEQISQNRKKSESQAQFLQSLLLHLDQAIIVVNGEGKIIHKNPASEKLLGTSISNLEVLGELGELIASTYVNSRATVSWQLGDSSDTLSVHISCCEIDSEFLKLVSIQSIHLALMTKEQQAYQRLTKVLTHEVANSITPMTSLAQTAQSLVPEPSAFDDAEDRQDLFEALNAIASRSSHLGMFIKSFHQIANLPSPNLQKVELSELIQQVLVLFKGQAQEQDIQLTFTNEANCLLTADPAQIEQVLINLEIGRAHV